MRWWRRFKCRLVGHRVGTIYMYSDGAITVWCPKCSSFLHRKKVKVFSKKGNKHIDIQA